MPTTAALMENSRQGINSKMQPCSGPDPWLSPNPRPGCGHAYDETPVGLVVYVRNDPVNQIDPDGQKSYYFSCAFGNEGLGECGWFPYFTFGNSDLNIGGPAAPDGKQSLKSEIRKRIDSRENCLKFLNGVIASLKSSLTVDKLLDNIANAQAIENATDLDSDVYEEVVGNTIKISPRGMKPHTFDWGRGTYRYYGDRLSLYLHAGFHLAASGSVSEDDLYKAAAPIARLDMGNHITRQQKSAIIGASFATACGSGEMVQPKRREDLAPGIALFHIGGRR